MKEIKLKFFCIFLYTLLSIIQPIVSLSKCNVPVLRKFTLSGMKYSVYDKMKICGHVHDKCCSVADEIRISKLWQQRTRPIVFQNIDICVHYMKKISEQFDYLAKTDPRSLSLKYIVQRNVPYEEQYCSFNQRQGNVRTSLRAVTIYRQSLRNSMRRLVDKVYGNNPQGRKLKLLYSDDNPFDFDTEKKMNKIQIENSKDKNIKEQRKLFGRQQLYEFLRNYRHIKDQPVEYTAAQCSKRTSSFYKDFVVVNTSKSSKCLGLLKQQFAFDNNKFKGYISKAKAGITKLAYYKANFYCSLCDAHQQKYFDLTRKKFIFSEHFCKNMLIKNEAVIKFLNIIMIEYIDFLFRIVSCFESTGNSKDNEATNFLQKYKRRIPLIQRCYQGLSNGSEFMKSCWFICHSFKPMKISEFYDGDVQLLKSAYLAVYSIIRKLAEIEEFEKEAELLDENIQDDSNVDGMLVEPPGPDLAVSNQTYLEEKSREQILGTSKVATKLSAVQINRLQMLFRKFRISGFRQFIKNYQSQFDKRSMSKVKSKYQKAYEKQIKRQYTNKVAEIKRNIKLHPHMNPKVLILFKKIFKENFTSQGPQSKVTPEHRPLRKLNNHNNERVLEESQNEVVRQAQILQAKIQKLKMKQSQSDYRQRTLREVTEAQIQQQQQHPGTPNQKEVKTGPKADAEPRDIVEPGSQVYQATLSLFDILDFQLEYQQDGMDLSKFTGLINFDEGVDDIISQKFKKDNQINLDVIDAYLSINPKIINRFNHSYKDFLMQAKEMAAITKNYTITKEQRDKAILADNQKETNRANYKLTKIQKKAHLQIMNQFEKQEHKEMKQKIKDLKREKMMNTVVEVNNHVDEKHFEKNFHGIKDLFVKLFGS